MEFRLLKIVSFSLMIASCVELAYMLFSPAYDRVTQSLVMLLSSFVVYQIAMIDQMNYFNSVGLLVTVPLIPLLLYYSNKNIDLTKKG